MHDERVYQSGGSYGLVSGCPSSGGWIFDRSTPNLSSIVGVMSARPGKFIEIIETGWPRDRTSEIVSEDRFGHITAHMWKLLREESQKAMKTS